MHDVDLPMVHQGVRFSVHPRCEACGYPRISGEIVLLTGHGIGRVGTWEICMCVDRMRCDRCPDIDLPFGWLTFARHLADHDA